MQLCYNLDTLRKTKTSDSITGDIFIKVADVSYPEDAWNDFIVVISTWWLNEFHDLIVNIKNRCEFNFMDGPYKLLIEIQNASVFFWTTDRDGKQINSSSVPIENIYQQLLALGRDLIQQCKNHQWETHDINNLKTAHEKLQLIKL